MQPVTEQPGIRERLLHGIGSLDGRGLEIGALHNPRLTRLEANIRYLDHATSEELRAKYSGNPDAEGRADDLVDVDFVWAPGKRLVEVLGPWAPVDYVIASHVIEHVANPIGWLGQIDESLVDGGVLSLVIPDKRYCFDVGRRLTQLPQLVDLYLRRVDMPTFEQIFDHEAHFLGGVSAEDLWDGWDPAGQVRRDVEDPSAFALQRCLELERTGVYQDVHASVFTPASFVDLFADLVRLELTGLELEEIFPTDRGSYEFFVTLRKGSDGSREARRGRQVQGAARARDKVAAFESASHPTETSGPVGTADPLGVLSDRERRLIELKRQVLFRLRRTLRR
jgi:hypothetical protein